jgi:hypothetical protein
VQILTFAASRRKSFWLLVLCALFTVGSFALLQADNPNIYRPDWPLWLGLVFWPLRCAVAGLRTARPPRLEMAFEGFTFVSSLGNTKRVLWRDVDEFFVWRSDRGGEAVAYSLRPDAQPGTVLGMVNRTAGMDGSLPNVWSVSADELVFELESMRQAALA